MCWIEFFPTLILDESHSPFPHVKRPRHEEELRISCYSARIPTSNGYHSRANKAYRASARCKAIFADPARFPSSIPTEENVSRSRSPIADQRATQRHAFLELFIPAFFTFACPHVLVQPGWNAEWHRAEAGSGRPLTLAVAFAVAVVFRRCNSCCPSCPGSLSRSCSMLSLSASSWTAACQRGMHAMRANP